jgi:hypothetical protein
VTARINHQYPLESCPKQDWHDLSGCTVEVSPPAATPTRADCIHDGRTAVGLIEDELYDWWPSFDRITTDIHDNSLEIYFEPHVEDLEPTPEQVTAIFSWGFSRFWMNFKGGKRSGGTERYYFAKGVKTTRACFGVEPSSP